MLNINVIKGKNNAQIFQLVNNLFENVEKHGLRLFHKEVNARYDMSCIELAFIQATWKPLLKMYKPPQK